MSGAPGKGTDGPVATQGTDFWVKVVGMLQQNWPLIEPEAMGIRVYFITDTLPVNSAGAFRLSNRPAAIAKRRSLMRFAVDS